MIDVKWGRKEGFIRIQWWLLITFCLLYAVTLYLISTTLRSEPHTDYGSVYQMALNLAKGESGESYWSYFARWGNNIGVMTVLSIILRIGLFLGFQDPYYFALLCNVIQVTVGLLCVFYLSGQFGSHKFVNQWMTVSLWLLWTPIWGNTNIFYSDQLSFGVSILAFTIWYYGKQRKRKIIWQAVAGFLWGVGAVIKITVLISLIAFIITFFLYEYKRHIRDLVITLCATLAVLFAFSLYTQTLPSQKLKDSLQAPVEYWIALGLQKDGSYASGMDFALECLNAVTLADRTQIAREEIVENWRSFFLLSHLVEKARNNFAIGDFGASGYLSKPMVQNILWEWFSQDGAYFWKYACLSVSFWFAILLILCLGSSITFIESIKHKKCENGQRLFFLCTLTVFGICLFVMLWEANNKQLYNQTPWLLLAVSYCMHLTNQNGRFKRNTLKL
jgi:hypothetical protein